MALAADDMVDCIVVGAGFAGLTAACRLIERGCSVVVLEARDRVGGRVKGAMIAGQAVDVGGMWLAPSQRRLAALADQFGAVTYPTPLTGRNVIELNGRRVNAVGDDFLPAVPLLAKIDLLRIDMKLKRMVRSIDVDEPWQHKKARQWDQCTFAEWLDRTCRTKAAWTVFEAICRSIFCAEPHQISLLFVLFYLKSGEGLDRLVSAAPGGAQNLLFDGGVHQVAEALARSLGERVWLDHPVTAIDQREEEIVVGCGEKMLRAKRVIVAVPPSLVEQITFTPELPAAKRRLLSHQSMGSCIKVWIAYSTPFWRSKGLNAFVALDRHPFNPFWDASPPGASGGLLVGFFDAVHAVNWRDKSPEDRREAVLAAIVDALGPEGAAPVDYIEQDWNSEIWSQGCYGAYLAPGALAADGHALRSRFDRIVWAGTETATEWSGYIEGAIQSGERAATEVAIGL